MTHKIGEPYYYVVEFLEKPVGLVDDCVCVPDFWTIPIESRDFIVSVAYPEESPIITKIRAQIGEKPYGHWKLYQAVVKYIPKSYYDSEIWIAKYHATVENKRTAEKGYRSVSALDGMTRSSGYFPSSVNKTLQTGEAPWKPSQKPMVRVSPVLRHRPELPVSHRINKNWSQTANAVQSRIQSLFEYLNPIDQMIHAVQRSSNMSKNFSQQPKRPVQKQLAPVIQNFSQYVPPKPEIWRYIPVCVENLLRERHLQEIAAARSNNVQIMMFTAQPIQNPSNEANQPAPHPVAATQFSQSANPQHSSNSPSIRNERTTEQNTVNASTSQSLTKESISTKRHVRESKYNPNNSKWTLKYRKRERGLEELVQDSGIYVNVIELAHCRRASDNCNTLARMLLTEVFSHKALTVCTLNGTRGKVHDGNKIRPGLDEFAIKVILKYVEDYGSENQWDKFDYKSVTKSMHNEISKIRAKYGN